MRECADAKTRERIIVRALHFMATSLCLPIAIGTLVLFGTLAANDIPIDNIARITIEGLPPCVAPVYSVVQECDARDDDSSNAARYKK